jgi:thiol-disulfide isomerase/thioredoxin
MNRIYFTIVFFLIAALSMNAQNDKNISTLKNDLKSMGLQVFDAGKKASDISATDINGKDFNLSEAGGKIIFLNFWASWCPPCKAEMPSIQKLYEKFKDKNVAFIAIDVGEPSENGLSYFKKNNYSFPLYFDKNNRTSSAYAVNSIPATYIIDKKGNLIACQIGSYEWDSPEFMKIMESLSALN